MPTLGEYQKPGNREKFGKQLIDEVERRQAMTKDNAMLSEEDVQELQNEIAGIVIDAFQQDRPEPYEIADACLDWAIKNSHRLTKDAPMPWDGTIHPDGTPNQITPEILFAPLPPDIEMSEDVVKKIIEMTLEEAQAGSTKTIDEYVAVISHAILSGGKDNG